MAFFINVQDVATPQVLLIDPYIYPINTREIMKRHVEIIVVFMSIDSQLYGKTVNGNVA